MTREELRYVYNGWNLMAEMNTSGTIQRSFIWGTDLDGSMGGTGGIGALLAVQESSGTYFPAYDGSGNVAAMIKASDGSLAAIYEYSPFGELLRTEGTYAATNRFRSATKYTDDDTGLVYYGYRYYHPSLGRFVNRDPIGEAGGLNLYVFAGNDPSNKWDLLGLDLQPTVNGHCPFYGWGKYGLGEYCDPGDLTPDVPGSVADSPDPHGSDGGGNGSPAGKGNAAAPNKIPCATLRALKVKALVEQNSYTNQAGGYVAGTNVERLSADQLTAAGISPSTLNDSQSGFQSAIYLNHDTGGYFAAFAGTQDGTDWKTNIGQPLGVHNTQYSEAAAVGVAAATAFGAANVEGIGHSLGGGLNVVASLRGRFSGTNFNPAGVGWITALENSVNLFRASKSIAAYDVPADPLTQLVNGNIGPATDGREVMLPSPGGVPYSLDRHGMAGVIRAIDKALAQNGCN